MKGESPQILQEVQVGLVFELESVQLLGVSVFHLLCDFNLQHTQ